MDIQLAKSKTCVQHFLPKNCLQKAWSNRSSSRHLSSVSKQTVVPTVIQNDRYQTQCMANWQGAREKLVLYGWIHFTGFKLNVVRSLPTKQTMLCIVCEMTLLLISDRRQCWIELLNKIREYEWLIGEGEGQRFGDRVRSPVPKTPRLTSE